MNVVVAINVVANEPKINNRQAIHNPSTKGALNCLIVNKFCSTMVPIELRSTDLSLPVSTIIELVFRLCFLFFGLKGLSLKM